MQWRWRISAIRRWRWCKCKVERRWWGNGTITMRRCFIMPSSSCQRFLLFSECPSSNNNNLWTNVFQRVLICYGIYIRYVPDIFASQICVPDISHLLGQRWHFVGSIVGPTLTNDVTRRHFAHQADIIDCQRLVRCWYNVFSPTTLPYANVMPTILFQVLRWANIVHICYLFPLALFKQPHLFCKYLTRHSVSIL